MVGAVTLIINILYIFFFHLGGVNKWKWVVIFVKFWS